MEPTPSVNPLRRRKIVVVIAFTAVMGITLGFVIYRIEANAEHNLDVTATPAAQRVDQGNRLAFYVNASSSGFPFALNGSGYILGLQLCYIGLSPNASGAAGSSVCTGPWGIAPFLVTDRNPTVVAWWNTTVVQDLPSGNSYYLAPAGYYRLDEGYNTLSGTRVSLHFTVSGGPIFVAGTHAELQTASNGTASLEIATLPSPLPEAIGGRVVNQVNRTTASVLWFNVSAPARLPVVFDNANAETFRRSLIFISTPKGELLLVVHGYTVRSV
jgi:hypothetical protein